MKTPSGVKSLRIEGLRLKGQRFDSIIPAFAVPDEMRIDVDHEIRWSNPVLITLQAVKAALAKNKENAPTNSLRESLLNVAVEAIYVEDRLFSFNGPICHVQSKSDGKSCLPEIGELLKFWIKSALVTFCRDRGVDEELVDTLVHHAENEQLCDAKRLEPGTTMDFIARRAVVFARIEQLLAGKIVFPEHGPLLVERMQQNGDELVFLTPPSYFADNKIQVFGSLILRFRMTILPGSCRHIVQLTGGRREWDLREDSPDYPSTAYLFLPEDSRVHKTVFPKGKTSLDLAWNLPVYLNAYKALQRSLKRADIGKAISNSAALYKLRTGRFRTLGRGLPPLDLSRALDGIIPLFSGAGLELLLPVEPRPNIVDKLDFDSEARMSFSTQRSLSSFLQHSSSLLTPGQIDMFKRLEQSDTLHRISTYIGPITSRKRQEVADADGPRDKVTPALVAKWKATADRFVDPSRKLAIISRGADDRDMMDEISKHMSWDLFSETVPYQLPADVHGIMAPNKSVKGTETERFQARANAWTTLIEDMKRRKITDVLVIAAKDYDGRPEDPINKKAAKIVFARNKMSSQYLIPRTQANIDSEKGGNDYLQRMLSALRDLCYGNRGVVQTPDNLPERLVDNGIDTRHIYGISLLKYNRTYSNRRSASILAVTRLDVETGLIDAMAFDGSDINKTWQPFHTVLEMVARTPSQDILGRSRDVGSRNVCTALQRVLDTISASDPNAVIIVDTRSAGLHQAWRWLQTKNVTQPVFLDEPTTAHQSWKSLNFILIDTVDAPPILSKGKTREGYYATSQTVAKITSNGDFGLYWYQAGPRDTMTLPRISCSVPTSDGYAPLGARTDFMMPRPLQIAIRAPSLDEQKAAFLLSLLVGLRSNHLTYSDESTLPSPLFQHARLKSDMCRLMTGDDGRLEFVLEEEDAADD